MVPAHLASKGLPSTCSKRRSPWRGHAVSAGGGHETGCDKALRLKSPRQFAAFNQPHLVRLYSEQGAQRLCDGSLRGSLELL